MKGQPVIPKILDEKNNFLGIPPPESEKDREIIIQPIPLEVTTTYMRGTGNGPLSLIRASQQVEVWDDELKKENYRGIATLEPLDTKGLAIAPALEKIEKNVAGLITMKKKWVFIGGEHSVTAGILRAFHHPFPEMTILHLDAHADQRETYEGSPYNHACVMARVLDLYPVVSVGIRSMCVEEWEKVQSRKIPMFTMHTVRNQSGWKKQMMKDLKNPVYISLDLDVLDPSVCPAVGTPEPGGMGWYECLDLLRDVFRLKEVVALDMVECCPVQGAEYGVFTAAKLLYRMIGYWLNP